MSSISYDLKRQIQLFWERVKVDSAFYNKIKSGTISGDEIGRLLAATRFLVSQTPHCLDLAISHSEGSDLRNYFSQAKVEEVGHDLWAEEDIRQAKKIFENIDTTLSPKMEDFVTWIKELIKEDTYLYVPYILWAEYLVVVSNGDLVHDLKTKCDIDERIISVFVKHAVLDVEHTSGDSKMIEKIVNEHPHYKQKYPEIIGVACEKYLEFLNDIAS